MYVFIYFHPTFIVAAISNPKETFEKLHSYFGGKKIKIKKVTGYQGKSLSQTKSTLLNL